MKTILTLMDSCWSRRFSICRKRAILIGILLHFGSSNADMVGFTCRNALLPKKEKYVLELALALFGQNSSAILTQERRIRQTLFNTTTATNPPAFHVLVDPQILDAKSLEQELQSGRVTAKVTQRKSVPTAKLQSYDVDFYRDGQGIVNFAIRTDGQTAYLHISHRYRSSEFSQSHYRGVELENGSIRSFDMTERILNDLPSTIKLSRSMSDAEKELWINKDFAALGSRTYDGKIHFGLGYFKYDRIPVQFEIPKSVLKALSDQGLLEINSYESIDETDGGMPPSSQTPEGLEVELVIPKSAAPSVQPWMAPALEQGILPLS